MEPSLHVLRGAFQENVIMLKFTNENVKNWISKLPRQLTRSRGVLFYRISS